MKKATIIYLLLFILAGSLAVFLIIKKKDTGTISTDSYQFAVEDTASISKIIITDHNGKKATLERKETGWQINNKFQAAEDRVRLLLETIKLVTFKEFVSEKAKRNVTNDMAASSMKVEIWKDKNAIEPFKSYFVGGITPDQLGTYMYLDGAREPVITFIQGFDGYLSGRYFTEENEWRSRKVFSLNLSSIKSVKLKWNDRNPLETDISLKKDEDGWVIKTTENEFTLNALQEGSLPIIISGSFAKPLFTSLSELYFENFVSDYKQSVIDSILNEKPFASFIINESITLNLVSKKADPSTKGVNKSGIDLDHLYGILSSNKKELLLLQWPKLKPLLRSFSELKQ